jgi:hypothetical protein
MLTLFWEDCKHVSQWCVKCCDLREAAQGGRSAALGGIKSSEPTGLNSVPTYGVSGGGGSSIFKKKFSVYSEGDSWRWKPIFSSFVDDIHPSKSNRNDGYFQRQRDARSSNNNQNHNAAALDENSFESVKFTSQLGTCAQVISYERRRGTVRLQISLGSSGGGDPVDDDSCFAFLIAGFVPSQDFTTPTTMGGGASSGVTADENGEWSMSTRSLSLACDPNAQIPKRRAADIPKSNAVRTDASVAAVIAASGRLATRAAMAVATGIATGG